MAFPEPPQLWHVIVRKFTPTPIPWLLDLEIWLERIWHHKLSLFKHIPYAVGNSTSHLKIFSQLSAFLIMYNLSFYSLSPSALGNKVHSKFHESYWCDYSVTTLFEKWVIWPQNGIIWTLGTGSGSVSSIADSKGIFVFDIHISSHKEMIPCYYSHHHGIHQQLAGRSPMEMVLYQKFKHWSLLLDGWAFRSIH